jgi:hypothetical protein
MAVDLRQKHFRFGADDGSESTHTFLANEDTNITFDPLFTPKFLLRFSLQEAGGTATVDTDFQFQYNLNGGGWTDITTATSVVKAVTPSAWANGANCTKRLSGTGTFEGSAAGCTADGTSGGANCDIAASGNTETECALELVVADLSDADVIQFQLTSPDLAITCDVTPSLTVSMVSRIAVSQVFTQFAYEKPPLLKVSQAFLQFAYTILEATVDPEASGGLVFGGEVTEVGESTYTDPAVTGGLVFGGTGTAYEPDALHQVDGEAVGGLVIGGEVNEQWRAEPNNLVAVKGGFYRISGVIYTLAASLSYTGLGTIAALVNCGVPPITAGYYRYDLLSIGAAGTITLTAGTAAATPVMPTTPTGEVKLDHVLRYYGQTSIIQKDIGKLYTAPTLTTLTATIDDDELSWGDNSTTVTIKCYDQYGMLYTGSKVVNASITIGNGTISPATKTGAASSFVFTYTRGGVAGDQSPAITFSSPAGASTIAFITLLDGSGNVMYA